MDRVPPCPRATARPHGHGGTAISPQFHSSRAALAHPTRFHPRAMIPGDEMTREPSMTAFRNSRARVFSLACGCAAFAASHAGAAEGTYEGPANPEPQNWLTHHHDFSAQRFSALDAINKTNAK